MAETIFARYGGFATVSRIISSFYDRVLDSPQLAPYFDRIDMRRLIDHQTKFVASLMGGPASYSDEHLARVHRHLDVDDDSFDEIVELLRETLEDFDFDESDIAAIHAQLSARRQQIVTRPARSVPAAGSR